jgi:tetratricopeptide (TPR) repeat protein
LPPPAPRDCFGHDELIKNVIELVENLKPVALIGPGGIGKTSISLTVLHHNRIAERFGDYCWFIRCNQFPASRPHFLARLSKVIGAGIENPEALTPLRPILSSKEALIILDNAESILDPKGTAAEEIYSVVDELCQFKMISLLITSRIMTVPPRCSRPEIPTLSIEAACDIFYDIYSDHGWSSIINDLLKCLDFHALSITLLAATASQHAWDYNRLAKEWDAQRARVLQTDHNKSLAATIELSLTSPTFRSLGPNARDLLGVVAFFPQGVNEGNLDWLFPDVPNGKNTLDKFCVLSLMYRSNGFVTMLAPIRDYIGRRNLQPSPLLCATRDQYFSQLSIVVFPGIPGFEEAQWIVSEDVNIEHLLDVFASLEPDRDGVWNAYCDFINHLIWHKARRTILGSKIEALPDDHRYKPECLSQIAQLLGELGIFGEQKRLLTHALELERWKGGDSRIAQTLLQLSGVNWNLGLFEEGMWQVKEALEFFNRVGNKVWQLRCSCSLAWMLINLAQFDAAEDVAYRVIDFIPETSQELSACRLHRIIGKISQFKREIEKAIHHFEAAIIIASPPNWHDVLYWNHYSLTELFRNEGEYDKAKGHIKQAKLHATNNAYKLGHAMQLQAEVWYRQLRLGGAKLEALCQEIVFCFKLFVLFIQVHTRFLRLIPPILLTPTVPLLFVSL